jgi:AraC-like DNA-binding protein
MNNFFIKQTFNNFTEMSEALYQWNLEIRQLKQCAIHDTIMQLKVENFLLGYAEFSGLTHQTGKIPPGRTFVFYTGENSKFLWRKKEIPRNGLLIFPLNSEVDVVVEGNKTIPHTISFPEEELTSRLLENERAIYETTVSNNDLTIMNDTHMEKLHEVFYRYTESAEEDPQIIDTKNFYTCLKEELISVLIEIVLNETGSDYPKAKDKMVLSWNKIENYIETHKSRPIMISELARGTNISGRSLYRMFQERFNLSPKAYLNTIRLNGVNNELREKSSCGKTISQIANSWGYWHMGQFASDYKKLFGELPSETLSLVKKNMEDRFYE